MPRIKKAMQKLKEYNKIYCKEVKPRYYRDYLRADIYIVTLSRDIYILHLRYFKKNYSRVIIARQKDFYIIIAKDLKW